MRQVDLADLLSLTQEHVSRVVAGRYAVPPFVDAYLDAYERLSGADREKLRRAARQRARSPRWWKELHVRRSATPAQIVAAYRRAARQAHPDAGGSHAAFLRVRAAYEAALKERGAAA